MNIQQNDNAYLNPCITKIQDTTIRLSCLSESLDSSLLKSNSLLNKIDSLDKYVSMLESQIMLIDLEIKYLNKVRL